MSLVLSQRYPAKRAFITGAASGLGLALCQHLARDGWTIGMADFSAEGLQKTAPEITAAGASVQTYLLDVSDRAGYQDTVDRFLQQNNGIDLLINNAGVGDGSPFTQYPLDNWDWMLSINLMGVVHGCYFFVPTMQAQKSGHIINIASIAGVANGAFMSAYNVSKAGVRSLSESLDHELTPYHIDVTAVMPGFFKTNVMQHARGNPKFLEFGHKQMERSEIDAAGVALEILRGAGAKKRDIFPTRLAKKTALTKRILPGYFRKLMKKYVSKS